MQFGHKLLILQFDHLCKTYEVRCLRNNIYQSVRVKDFNHLVELWNTHPLNNKNDNKEPLEFIPSILYIFRNEKRGNLIGKHETFFGFFSLYVGWSEQQVIENIKKNCINNKYK